MNYQIFSLENSFKFSVLASLGMHAALVYAVGINLKPEKIAQGKENSIEVNLVFEDGLKGKGKKEIKPEWKEYDSKFGDYIRDNGISTVNNSEINLKNIWESRDELFPFLFDQNERTEKQEKTFELVYERTDGIKKKNQRKTSLNIGDKDLQTLVDSAWARKDKYDKFKVLEPYFRDFDGNDGRLHELTQQYAEQNFMQPYSLKTLSATALGFLEINSSYYEFYKFNTKYIEEHPSTKTSMEMVFFLEKMARGEHSSLEKFLRTWSVGYFDRIKKSNTEAYDLVNVLYDHYSKLLSEKGFFKTAKSELFSDVTIKSIDFDKIREHYTGVRLAYLQRIIKESPDNYRLNDAYFLIGKIHLDKDDAETAIKTWKKMEHSNSKGDIYGEIENLILLATKNIKGKLNLNERLQIDNLLIMESRRIRELMIERLSKFGHTQYTF